MRDRDHARMLLALAEHHLRALRHMDDPAAFTDDVFGFQAQQAVEKALKAWLAVRGATYPKTHDLDLLASRIEALGERLPTAFDRLVELNDFGVIYRYELFDDEPLDRDAVRAAVEAVFVHVRQVIEDAAG